MKTPLLRIAALVAALLLGLGACSSGSSDSGSSGGAAAGSAASGDAADTGSESSADSRSAADPAAGPSGATALARDPDERVDPKAPPLQQLSIISTGSVSLTAEDVARARAAVRQVATSYAGTVTDEQTTTADDERMGFAQLVLRVPSRSFSRAMADLERVAELVDSDTTSEDVSTQVIDVDERVKAARASIERITTLLGRAEKIGDIMAIEAQLSSREADLNSLLRQQAHLADQTSLATITVSIDRPAAAHARRASDHGFLAGLRGGWHALQGFATGTATVVGALLPWMPVALLVGVPVWLLVRRVRRTAAARPPAAEVSA